MNIKNLRREINVALTELKEDNNISKSKLSQPYRLNYFKILGLSRNELIHSRFIAFLLNPDRRYKFKDTFLNMFIALLRDKHKAIIEDPFPCKSVRTEKGLGKNRGRVDIFIKNNNSNKDIIIENKIDALDQNEQLERYHNQNKDATLVYLTLNGRKASRRSEGTLTKDNYIKLSYKEDISEWIEMCIDHLQKIKHDKLIFLLTEYLAVINELTKEIAKKEKLLPILSKDKETVENVFKIHDEVYYKRSDDNTNKEIFKLINPLKAYIIKTKFCSDDNNESFLHKLCNEIDHDLKWKINEDIGIMKKWWGFQFYKEEWEKVNVMIRFQFERKLLESCIYGLSKCDPKKPFVFDFKDKSEKGSWLYRRNMSKYFDWHRCVFFELMENNIESTSFFKELKDIIKLMIDKIDNEIIIKH